MHIKNAEIIKLFNNIKVAPNQSTTKLTIDPNFLFKARQFVNQYDFVYLINNAIEQYNN